MPPKRKLLVVTSDFVGRGAERELANLLSWLPRDRFAITLCLWRAVFDYPRPEGVPIVILEKHRAWDVFKVRRRFQALVERERPDLVFSQLNYVNTVTGSALGGCSSRPAWLCRFAGNPQVEIRWPVLPWTRHVARRAERVAGCSRGACDALVSHLGVARERVRLLPNVVDVTAIRKGAEEGSALARDAGRFVFVHAGRHVAQKNHALLLQAFAEVSERSSVLWLLGTGPLEKEHKRLAARLGIAERVRFLGHVANPHALFRQANAFVLASRYEGLPNVVIEAMLCGLPVVSTDCPFGPSELIREGATGYLTPLGDAKSLAERMSRSAADPEGARRMGSLAAEEMGERFDPARIVPEYVKLFEETIEERAR